MACGTRALHSTIGTADTDASRMQFEKKIRTTPAADGRQNVQEMCRRHCGVLRSCSLTSCFSRASRSVRTFFAAVRSAKQKNTTSPHFQQQAQVKMRTRSRPCTAEEEEARIVTDLLGRAVHSERMIIFCTFPAVSISFSTLRQDCPRSVRQFAVRHLSEERSRAAFPPMRC